MCGYIIKKNFKVYVGIVEFIRVMKKFFNLF